MKALRIFSKGKLLIAALLIGVACEEDGVKAVLNDPTTFVAPALTSPATADPVVFTPEDEADEYETFVWTNADYGIHVSVRYELEVAADEDFTEPKVVATVEGLEGAQQRSLTVTVKQMNDAVLALGLPAFQEATVMLRVKSSINNHEDDPLYSAAITRTVTPYRLSNCGNHCTIGIIGDATADPTWSIDTDMHLADPEGIDKYSWTLTTYLKAGAMKFRAGDDWAVNWGADAFPSGTGTQDGPNIPIPGDGYYKIDFNDATGEYNITAITNTFASIGVIGSATAHGWDGDTELTQDPNDPHVWTGTVDLVEGEVKFRKAGDWGVNWGSTSFPSGYGTANGPNIPIAVAGTYFVWFNDASGEFMFGPTANSAPYASVGLIGTATPNSWDGPDMDLIQNPANAYKWSKILTITDGEAKFRADDDWAVNWGASPFPEGRAVQGGANIPAKAGKYFVTFNSLTGEYLFLN